MGTLKMNDENLEINNQELEDVTGGMLGGSTGSKDKVKLPGGSGAGQLSMSAATAYDGSSVVTFAHGGSGAAL